MHCQMFMGAAHGEDFDRTIDRGRDLLDATRMIGDADDFDLWRLRRGEWELGAVRALDQIGDEWLIARFRTIVTPELNGDFGTNLSAATGCVREALEMLAGLREESAFALMSASELPES